MTSLTRERRATLEWAIEAAVEKGYTSDADVIRDLLSELLSASKPAAPKGWKLVPDHADADAIVTSLYRRFKDWSKRGFGPDDVTWCEVKADVLAMLAASPAAPAQSDEPVAWPRSLWECQPLYVAQPATPNPMLDKAERDISASQPVKLAQPVEKIVDVSDLFADRATVIRVFDFYKKHAIGSLAAPSCLCCGRSTQDVEVAIKHMELPDIVVCAECHRAIAQPVEQTRALDDERAALTDAEVELLVSIKRFHTHEFGRGPELHSDAITDAYKKGRAASPQPVEQTRALTGEEYPETPSSRQAARVGVLEFHLRRIVMTYEAGDKAKVPLATVIEGIRDWLTENGWKRNAVKLAAASPASGETE